MIYEIIEMKQGSSEWIAKRFDYITATDVPVILEANPWKTHEELLKYKVEKKEETHDQQTLDRFENGHKAENTARRILTDYNFKDIVIISKEFPFLWASLDGFDIDKNVILEAKWTGNRKKLLDAKKGKISYDHYLQMQAQLIVSGANYCVYYITNGESYTRQVVKPDPDCFKIIPKKAELFIKEVRKLRDE